MEHKRAGLECKLPSHANCKWNGVTHSKFKCQS